MTSPLTILRQRRHRRHLARTSSSHRTRRLAFGFGFIVSVAGLALLLAAALGYASLTRGLPPVEQLPVLLDTQDGLLRQPTRLYDRTGQHLIQTLAPTDAPRTFLTYDQFPPALVNATLALVEPDFWYSPGYEIGGWRDPETHPTLAQRLVSELLLYDAPASPLRGIHERMLAAQVTAQYGRQQVLEWYLNSLDFGNRAYGVEAAAQLYFGKSASLLDLGESALLAAAGQAPALNPLDAPNAAESRRVQTLMVMQGLGLLTTEQAAQEIADPPVLQTLNGPAAAEEENLAPAFVELVLAQLSQYFGPGRVERGGLVVTTSLDYDLQLQVLCTIRNSLERLAGDNTLLPAAPGAPCEAAALLPALAPGESLPAASASAVVLDPHSGQILAAVGDIASDDQSTRLASHPAGTSITPFIYLTGFSRGLNPASLGWDIPGSGPDLGQVYHGPVRLRIALVNDYLAPAQELLAQMGQDSVETIFSSSSDLKSRLGCVCCRMISTFPRWSLPRPMAFLQIPGR